MTGWGRGYVTDINYTAGYYRPQSPHSMQVACLLGYSMPPALDPGAALSYLELGCGLGVGALLLAASNPHWRVTGIDFNPAHVAFARSLAAAAGIENATFLEADLSTLAEDPLAAAIPEADMVSLHGVWTWVPDSVRAGIVRLLRARVRPGGLVHVSYNVLPGWQGALGMQRLLRESGRGLAVRSDRQAQAGLEVVRALAKAKAPHVSQPGIVTAMLERVDAMPAEYLAHEMMNEAWRPSFHADVAAAFAEAKLDWVAASQPLENFPALMMTDEQREVHDRFDDPLLRELVKDLCLERGLRNDVFIRGARRLEPGAHRAALGEVMLALTVAPERFAYAAGLPAGKAEMATAFYQPMVARLAAGPCRVRELLALPDVAGARDNPGEVVAMLIGTEQAVPVSGPACPPTEAARRLNVLLADRLVRPATLGRGLAFATGGCGSPLPAPLIDLYAHRRLAQADGVADPAGWAADLVPDSPAESQAEVQNALERLLDDRSVWVRFGLC